MMTIEQLADARERQSSVAQFTHRLTTSYHGALRTVSPRDIIDRQVVQGGDASDDLRARQVK